MSSSEGPPRRDTNPEQPPLKGARDRFYDGAAAGATALIVEDDFRNMFALTAVLQRGKMFVVTAESGPRALTILERNAHIGIVLMDIMMPVMDGYETMAEIRKRPLCAKLPIIAVTGKAVVGERARCLAAGASDYIPKPVDTTALVTAIGRWLLTATADLPAS
jgi:CheY-like chemotaxis protein